MSSNKRWLWLGLAVAWLVHCLDARATDQAVWSIAEFVTCADAKMEAPHDWHVAAKGFQITDDKFFGWVEISHVSGVHSVDMKAYRPDGSFYGKETQTINETNGAADWWRMAAWWRIRDDKPAENPGRWKLELLIDGVLQGSVYFEISGEKPAPAVSAPQPSGVCIIETSADLVNWTPVQTNALPAGLSLATFPLPLFRVKLAPPSSGGCVVEFSREGTNWMPFLTNSAAFSSIVSGSAGFYRAVAHQQ